VCVWIDWVWGPAVVEAAEHICKAEGKAIELT
jgi:hypothetical protein